MYAFLPLSSQLFPITFTIFFLTISPGPNQSYSLPNTTYQHKRN